MFKRGYYSKMTKSEIRQSIKNEGFDPLIINNSPGYTYSKHHHLETKILAFLDGSIEVTVNNDTFNCKKGDKLIIPGNTEHSAVVGEEGCLFFWAEKIL